MSTDQGRERRSRSKEEEAHNILGQVNRSDSEQEEAAKEVRPMKTTVMIAVSPVSPVRLHVEVLLGGRQLVSAWYKGRSKNQHMA